MFGKSDLISERSAWTGRAIGGKDGLVYRFTAEHLDAMRALLAQTAHLPIEAVTKEQFAAPSLTPFLAKVAEELSDGRGAAVLSALPCDDYSEDELTRIYWGICTHLGKARPQNDEGALIDHVRDTKDNPLGRRQYGTEELVFHTDGITGQNLALLSLSKSKSGGLSRLASALAIHNAFVLNHPDLLELLYEGFPYHRKGKQRAGSPILTPFPVPTFSKIDGIVTVQYIRDYMEKAAPMVEGGMPPKLRAALDYFDSIANDDSMNVTFMLEPGEIMLVNNRAVLHSRTQFEDFPEPERKRHLVRLWMDVPNGRPYKREMDYLERAWRLEAPVPA